jgi:hypothetical protein
VRAFTFPLFALSSCSEPTRVAAVVEILQSVCPVLTKPLSFGKLLERAVVEWQELPFGFVRSSLLAIVNDYEYDIDQKLSIVLLYHHDEVAHYAKYMRETISGTKVQSQKCGSCKKNHFGVSCSVHVFACGHAFHETAACLPKAVCPVCHPEERLDQNNEGPVQSVPRSRLKRELMRFEARLREPRNISVADIPNFGDLEISPIGVFPL